MQIGKKTYILLAIFIGLTLMGILGLNIYPINVIRSTHTAYSNQNISFNLYQPRGLTQPTPVVVMGHGIIVNKEMMTNFAIELAKYGFIVASLDWSGHGQSDGYLSNLSADLEAVIDRIPSIQPLANMSALALLGYSMGGFGTYPYAVSNPNVTAWVGVGTRVDGSISNMTNPRNVLLIMGSLDEAFSPMETKLGMLNLTGLADPDDFQFNYLYGNISNGTARKVQIVPGIDHLVTPWSEEFVKSATIWITSSFGAPLPTTPDAFNLRNFFAWSGFMGLVALIFVMGFILADKMNLKKELESDSSDYIGKLVETQSTFSFIGKYYLFTFLLLPSIMLFVPAMLFIPLPLTTALSALVGCLGVNLLIYSWRLAKKGGTSIKALLKENFFQGINIWIYSILLTVIFFVAYYLTIGLNYLGMIPSVQRIPYLILIMVLSFIVFWIYSIFIQKFSTPFFEKKLHKGPVINYLAVSLINFLLIDSWFVIIILIPCILMANFFFAMILILMVPIFLFLNFFGVYMEKMTGSTIPNALFHAILLSFVITTLSPFVELMGFFGIFL